MEWSPDVVSRSVKYCKTRVQNGVIVQSESEVQNRAKVRDGAGQNNEMKQT